MWALDGPSALVGRSPAADLVIADPTVSREHCRIHTGPPLRVEALTPSNGTFLDGVPIAPGTAAQVGPGGARLQLGGVLLAIGHQTETQPVREPLAAPTPEPHPILTVTWDAGQCLVRCGGRDLSLPSAPARLLALLAARAGEIVHHWDLQEELGTPHLAPLVTAARRALAAATTSGTLPEALVRRRIERAYGDPGPADLSELMRRLLRVRRGHGYVLNLAHEDVLGRQV